MKIKTLEKIIYVDIGSVIVDDIKKHKSLYIEKALKKK